VALVGTDVSEEHITSSIRVEESALLVTANVHSLLILSTLII
jgi:hypothetical protein